MPLTDLQTRFIAGQFPTGRATSTLPTQNKLITHNLLFDYTRPWVHRRWHGYDRGKWVTKAMVAKVNQKADTRGRRARWPRTASITRAVNSRVSVGRRLWQGAELGQPAGQCGRHSNLGLFEIDGYFIRGDWTVQGQLSYGTRRRRPSRPTPPATCRPHPGTACRRWRPTSSRRGSRASGASTTSTTGRTAAACWATAPTMATASALTATLGCDAGLTASTPAQPGRQPVCTVARPKLRLQPVHDLQGRGPLRLGQPTGLPVRRRQRLPQEQHAARRSVVVTF